MSVPERLDLEGAHQVTCDFVREVREAVRRGDRVRLVFDNVRQIRRGALIFLLAQIHKLRIQYGESAITGTYPMAKAVERQLTESGFFDLLKVKARITARSPANRYIRFKSDQKINGIDIRHLREELLRQDLKMPPAIARAVFRALSEAMTNVNHHAYSTKAFPSPSDSLRLRGRWWLFANLNVPQNLFVLTFYDTGVGIPKTLPRKYGMELITQLFSLLPGILPDDAQMIEAAMRLGRTRTELDYRGKGLLDLAKLIDLLGAGQMQIHSRHGSYTYTPGAQSRVNRPGFLEGTLIEWRLPIDKALSELPKDLYDQAEDEDQVS